MLNKKTCLIKMYHYAYAVVLVDDKQNTKQNERKRNRKCFLCRLFKLISSVNCSKIASNWAFKELFILLCSLHNAYSRFIQKRTKQRTKILLLLQILSKPVINIFL